MLQEAIVTKICGDGLAEVVVERSSLCGGNCSECDECRYENLMKSVVRNTIGAHSGQRVVIETPTKGIFKGALAIYVLPIVLLVAGYFAAEALSLSEGLCILAAFVGAVLGVVLANVISKKQQAKDPLPSKIVSFIYD